MGIDIKIHIDLTPRQKKIVRVAVVTGAVIGSLGLGMAIAAPINTAWIVDGGAIGATNLKGDLDGLQAQLTAGRFVVTIAAHQYSLGATKYVSATTIGGPNSNGQYTGAQINGYANAKVICEALSGASAHMCSAEELLRSAQAGVPIAQGWYSSAQQNTYSTTGQNWDCQGWKDVASTDTGPLWQGGPNLQYCTKPAPVLCCD